MVNTVRKSLDCVIESIESSEKKVYRFVASNSNKDRGGDIIEVDGWDTTNWEKNPVILWGHNHKELPIGRGVCVSKNLERNALVIDVEFTPRDIYPFGAMVGDMVAKGFIKAVSVGFKPIEAETIDGADVDSWFPPQHFKKQELLELSLVNVPMHPEALLVANSVEEREILFQKGFRLMEDSAKVEQNIKADIKLDAKELAEVFAAQVKIIMPEILSGITASMKELAEVSRGLAHLVEFAQSTNDTCNKEDIQPSPGDKPAGLAEEYLKSLESSATELVCLVSK